MRHSMLKRTVYAAVVGSQILLSSSANSAQRAVKISLSDVVRRVASQNFVVQENAVKLYQAKQAIQVARGNLLPKLNLWRIANVAVDASMGNYVTALGVIANIAPFLVPNNWFRVTEQKFLFEADLQAYKALWANEVLTAKALYFHLLLDLSLLEHIEESHRELERLFSIAVTREDLGGLPRGTSRDIEIRMLALQEDQRGVKMLLAQEQSALAVAMGYPANTTLRVSPVALPSISSLKPLQYEDYEPRVLSASPELKQFESLVAVADSVKKEVMYLFLGASDVSRGVGGGVFDNLPVQDGLGFGTPASMRIMRAQKNLLMIQRRGVEETLKRHLQLLVSGVNLDIANHSNLKRRTELSRAAADDLQERLELGQDVAAIELIEASRNRIQAETAYFGVQYRMLADQDRLARLTLRGDYAKPEVPVFPPAERVRKWRWPWEKN